MYAPQAMSSRRKTSDLVFWCQEPRRGATEVFIITISMAILPESLQKVMVEGMGVRQLANCNQRVTKSRLLASEAMVCGSPGHH